MSGHLPGTAAREGEDVSLTGYNPGNELNGAAGGSGFDLPYRRRCVAPLEEAGFDHRLNGCGSATGRRGALQREHLGYGDPDFLAA